jgi:hypothetical protein
MYGWHWQVEVRQRHALRSANGFCDCKKKNTILWLISQAEKFDQTGVTADQLVVEVGRIVDAASL